ncbi:hypothetical protein [Limnoraphis robusta]|uniref:NACHT N-terminal helical domain-containing protein n=2 Tax=Limnoraphis TaxID=1332112 RepID=A0ABU5U368_9CYAN|nr:hypothetical protein [Limnoraphis robusta]MEA5521626.1 hypothetical protein [Limnoraphis robusta CCNP1315]MEA5545190.1 hypothetical protein [Limnoraphis robusta CCNP1324]
MFIIDDVIAELVSQGVVAVQDRLNRNEKALKILNKFQLKPEEPPADFEGIYVYTLIEYGVVKSETILQIFREDEIKSAFQEAFEQNNPNLLLEQTEQYLENYYVGQQIKSRNIDYRRELAEFSALFIEIIKQTRLPKEILADHKLKNLQNSLAEIQQQVQTLNFS